MVTLNMESRKLVGRMYPENRFKNAKARRSERVKISPPRLSSVKQNLQILIYFLEYRATLKEVEPRAPIREF